MRERCVLYFMRMKISNRHYDVSSEVERDFNYFAAVIIFGNSSGEMCK